MTTGQQVEDWNLYGLDRELSQSDRDRVISFARSFEECSHTTEELRR